MGVKELKRLLDDYGSSGVSNIEYRSLYGLAIAFDGNMTIQQLLTVRLDGRQTNIPLTDEDGETNWHVQGLLNRLIEMSEAGIKPVAVFGSNDFITESQTGGRAQNRTKLRAARSKGDARNIARLTRRLLRVSSQQIDDCVELCRLMGVPVVRAPDRAVEQCVELEKNGKVYATASDDMGALPLGSHRLLRNFTLSQNQQYPKPVGEYCLDKVIRDLSLTNAEEFVDLCILLGCDYGQSPVSSKFRTGHVAGKTPLCLLFPPPTPH
jgi:flap endonuclease-1